MAPHNADHIADHNATSVAGGIAPADTAASVLAPFSPTLLCHLDHTTQRPLAELISECRRQLQAHASLFALFGRPATADEPPGVCVTAVLLGPDSGLQVLRGHAQAAEAYPSLTPTFPAAQIHERELWEQTGLVPQGHPWLKPVRFEGALQGRTGEYPFFKVRGPQVHEVGVGPIHAGVIEPGHFRFMCHGEQVHHLEIQLGYQHRGVEALLLRTPPHRLTPLVESIVGDSAVAYAWGFNSALESASKLASPLDTEASRAIGLEFERVAIHLATLNGLATDIAYLQAAATYGRLRTAIINASQRLCGNRFGRGWIRPGAAAPLTDALRQDALATLRAFLPDFLQVNHLMRHSRSTRARFQGVGTVSTQAARDLGLTGVVARASGVPLDVRQALPSALYRTHPVPAHTEPAGDCWARMAQRMAEAEASTQWLIDRLSDAALNLADTPGPFAQVAAAASSAHHSAGAQANPWALTPRVLCVSLTEGVRGPVMVALETGHSGQLVHAKVQDPSMANWFGLAYALRNQAISDFPICNKSFDLSYCGNDL